MRDYRQEAIDNLKKLSMKDSKERIYNGLRFSLQLIDADAQLRDRGSLLVQLIDQITNDVMDRIDRDRTDYGF